MTKKKPNAAPRGTGLRGLIAKQVRAAKTVGTASMEDLLAMTQEALGSPVHVKLPDGYAYGASPQTTILVGNRRILMDEAA